MFAAEISCDRSWCKFGTALQHVHSLPVAHSLIDEAIQNHRLFICVPAETV